ncbi:MAG TPA: BON domain-containing protein [Xanthobacteraceae bacterium]|jgi:osmotically-inducible protein OsmY
MNAANFKVIVGALIVVASLGLAACASNARVPATRVATQSSYADVQLADNVQAALHADPFFYDRHVTVSVERGKVVLRGFVADGEAIISAKRIAAKAAGGRPVVDYLSINPIEEQSPGPRR